ncbi:MAG TPA: glycosyltransferase [Magnetovibrio sp.]
MPWPIAQSPNIKRHAPPLSWDTAVQAAAAPTATAQTSLSISIVIPVLNRASMVRAAIESILAQNGPPVEIIVADGGSTDGTIDIIGQFPQVRLLPGPDADAHDGMNRGAAAAKGDVIGFLASDDVYLPDAFDSVRQAFAKAPLAVAVAAPALVFRTTSDGTREVTKTIHQPATTDVLADEVLFGTPAINAWFIRKAAFDTPEPFRRDLAFAGDRAFLLHLIADGNRITVLDHPIYGYGEHPHSSTLDAAGSQGAIIVADHITLASELLTSPSASAINRRALRAWLAFESVHLILMQASQAGWISTFGKLIFLFASQPLWPLRILDAIRRWRRLHKATIGR